MPSVVSEKLLAAALGGLMAATPACSSGFLTLHDPVDDAPAPSPAAGTDASTSTSTPDSDGPGPGDGGVVADANASSRPVTDASIACTVHADPAAVTSSTQDPNMSLATFSAECAARGGVVEVEPHCGGLNSCRGVSWDTITHVVSEHTCKGMNTCAGYSCIICS
jgi:hypothetical protein